MSKVSIEFQGKRLPAKYVVCGRCEGTGAHVNPNIDGNGLDPELAADPEFMEDYLTGAYDVVCENCKGERLYAVPDFSKWSSDDIVAWGREQEERINWENEMKWERRMLGDW